MPEHSDIYLLLYRQQGTYKEVQVNKLTAPVVAKTLTKGMIIGDSLDAPFVGFIKCLGIEHNIGLSAKQHELEWDEAHLHSGANLRELGRRALDDTLVRAGYDRAAITEQDRRHLFNTRRGQQIDAAYHKAVKQQRNAFINTHLPEHGEFQFVKMIDRATPQLAFGCCAQERFPLALFLYRKKIGTGIGGIRVPHLVVALRKVRISAWKITGEETEEVTLRYGDVSWASLGQIADTDVPVPIPSARTFDAEALQGGENYSSSWAYGIQFLAVALCAITGGVIKGVTSTSGSYG